MLKQERRSDGTLDRVSQIINHEPPPPYEEAVKYPSISSLLSNSAFEHSSYAGIFNNGLVRDSIMITITNEDSSSFGNEETVEENNSSVFGDQTSYPTTSQVTFSPPFRSLSCNDLLNIPSLPCNEKSSFSSSSPFYNAVNTCSVNKNTIPSSGKSKLPLQVNFTLKVNANQASSSSTQANHTSINETICLEENCSPSKNTSINDDGVPSATATATAVTQTQVETSTNALGNTIDRQQ